jgi:hypothetical protein
MFLGITKYLSERLEIYRVLNWNEEDKNEEKTGKEHL